MCADFSKPFYLIFNSLDPVLSSIICNTTLIKKGHNGENIHR